MVSSYALGRGCKEWPEVVLKINAATVGLDERSASRAFEAVREKKGEENMTRGNSDKKCPGQS